VLIVFLAGCATAPDSRGESRDDGSPVADGAGEDGTQEIGPAAAPPDEMGRAGEGSASDPAASQDGTPEDHSGVTGPDDPPRLPPVLRGETDPVEQAITAIIGSLSLEDRVGQMLMPALPGGTPDELTAFVRDVAPGGIILFGPDIRSADQVRTLVEDLQRVSAIPLIVATDQEGGVVRRVVPSADMPATPIPAASVVGRTGDADLAYDLGRVVGSELRSLGITMNFAPVADVRTNPNNPVTGSRAYGSDPDLVGEMVEATVRGLQSVNVSAVVKHFPGHGDTVQDSHESAARIPHDLVRLQAVELVPFARGIAAGADGVMIGHITVPAVSGANVPATLDAVIVRGILRERMEFDGVIVTDSLTMGGLTRYYDERSIVVQAVLAGADILLQPARPGDALGFILDAVADGTLSEGRINESVRRILRLKFRRELLELPDDGDAAVRRVPVLPETITIGSESHRNVVDLIEQRAADGRENRR
jgi:beta-N-acetylhexosaminidase